MTTLCMFNWHARVCIQTLVQTLMETAAALDFKSVDLHCFYMVFPLSFTCKQHHTVLILSWRSVHC